MELANKKHRKEFTHLDLHVLRLIAKSLGKGVSNFQRAELLVSSYMSLWPISLEREKWAREETSSKIK